MKFVAGCDLCRDGWYTRDLSPYIFEGRVIAAQSDFYSCRHCATWWQDTPLGRPRPCEKEQALTLIKNSEASE